MGKKIIKDKNGKIIGDYDSKAKGYRYYIDGKPKTSATTVIGKRMDKSFLQRWWRERGRTENLEWYSLTVLMKTIM